MNNSYQTSTLHPDSYKRLLDYLLEGSADIIIDYDRSIYNQYRNDISRRLLCQEEYLVLVHKGHKWFDQTVLSYDDICAESFISVQEHVPWLQEFMYHFQCSLQISAYDRWAWANKIQTNHIPILYPATQPAYTEGITYYKNMDIETKYIPLQDFETRPLYLYWLNSSDSKVQDFLGKLERFK